ncbi:MAG: alpha/beta hydrolase [Solirubrobacteraceae bacterium]
MNPNPSIRARLVPTHTPASPKAAVLVLHGGAARDGRAEVSPTQLSVLRMIPIARRIAAVGRGRLAVYRLLNSTRGWDTSHTPVDDVRWALAQIAGRHGDLPTALVGHSLGGRAALLAGGSDPVRSVVALNPWVYPSDDADLSGRRVLIVHGTEDRVAPVGRARAVAQNLARRTAVDFREVSGGTHAMLLHRRAFEDAATSFVADSLL